MRPPARGSKGYPCVLFWIWHLLFLYRKNSCYYFFITMWVRKFLPVTGTVYCTYIIGLIFCVVRAKVGVRSRQSMSRKRSTERFHCVADCYQLQFPEPATVANILCYRELLSLIAITSSDPGLRQQLPRGSRYPAIHCVAEPHWTATSPSSQTYDQCVTEKKTTVFTSPAGSIFYMKYFYKIFHILLV